MRVLRILTCTVVAVGLLTVPAAAEHRPAVRLLGERIVPAGQFQGTTVGGLSGIDREPRTGGYVLVSDDRSDKQPARFYTARIDVTENGLGEVRLTGTHPFLRPDGTTYPPLASTDGTAATSLTRWRSAIDPEDIRVDPWTGDYVWSQEGERIVQPDRQVLIDPSIQVARRDGSFVRKLPLPPNERMSAQEQGPRQNQALEALTFAGGGMLVVSALEGALLQDGPEATPTSGATSRITVQSRGSGRVLAQYAYRQEPVFANPNPPGAFANNGVTAILAANPVDPTKYLVLERSFVTGVGNKVRLFEIDLRGATNIASAGSVDGAVPVRKRLVADLADVGLSTVDNVEGMTWGPTLRTGERTLLLVSDDNFAPSQVTQVIALALR